MVIALPFTMDKFWSVARLVMIVSLVWFGWNGLRVLYTDWAFLHTSRLAYEQFQASHPQAPAPQKP